MMEPGGDLVTRQSPGEVCQNGDQGIRGKLL